MTETFSNANTSSVNTAAQTTKPFATQPPSPYGGTTAALQSRHSQPSNNFFMKPYLVGAVIAGLILFLGYQQMQINQLSGELGKVSDNIKSNDVRTRLETQEANLGELNTRLAYLDSKINATDQKAQAALSRIKAHEDGDVIGNVMKGIKQTLGIK